MYDERTMSITTMTSLFSILLSIMQSVTRWRDINFIRLSALWNLNEIRPTRRAHGSFRLLKQTSGTNLLFPRSIVGYRLPQQIKSLT
jgi:hypothetical protein